MSKARLRSIATWAIVVGVTVVLIAVFMLRSGNEHQRDYEAFRSCVRSGTTFCSLEQKGSQADSVSDYKDNFERQILLSQIGIALGVILVVGGITLRIVTRRRDNTVAASAVGTARATPAPAPVPGATAERPAPGWYDDPSTQYQRRYWSGAAWTDQVSTDGTRSTDPSFVPAVAPAEPSPTQHEADT